MSFRKHEIELQIGDIPNLQSSLDGKMGLQGTDNIYGTKIFHDSLRGPLQHLKGYFYLNPYNDDVANHNKLGTYVRTYVTSRNDFNEWVIQGRVTADSSPTTTTITLQDGGHFSSVTAPTFSSHMTNKGYVDGLISGLVAKTGTSVMDPSGVLYLEPRAEVQWEVDSPAHINSDLQYFGIYQNSGMGNWMFYGYRNDGGLSTYLSMHHDRMEGWMPTSFKRAVTFSDTVSVPKGNFAHTDTSNHGSNNLDDAYWIDRTRLTSINITGDTGPSGNGWWNLINMRHRDGEGDGNQYGGQIIFDMGASDGEMHFRRHNAGTWGAWHQVGVLDKAQSWSGHQTFLNEMTITSGTSGDATLWMISDTDNNSEGDQPGIRFVFDGGGSDWRWGPDNIGASNAMTLERMNGSMPLDLYITDGVADTRRVFHDAYHPNADKWTTARTLTLAGDLAGNVPFDGSANFTLNAQIQEGGRQWVFSHAAQGEAAVKIVRRIDDASNVPALIVANDGEATDVIAEFRANASGVAVDMGDAANSADAKHIFYGNGAATFLGTLTAPLFEGKATSASKWHTARTLSLTGHASGSVSLDGTANGSINVVVTTVSDQVINGSGNWHTFVNDGGGNIGQRWNATKGGTNNLVENGIAYELQIDNDDPFGAFNLYRSVTANQLAGEEITWDRVLSIYGDTGKVNAPRGFSGDLQGNASTATALQTARYIELTGAVVGEVLFDGTARAVINTSMGTHSHVIGDITGLQTALDDKASASHTHSGYAASSHTHSIANITGLQSALDDKAAASHTHSGYAAASHTHSYLPLSGGTLTSTLQLAAGFSSLKFVGAWMGTGQANRAVWYASEDTEETRDGWLWRTLVSGAGSRDAMLLNPDGELQIKGLLRMNGQTDRYVTMNRSVGTYNDGLNIVTPYGYLNIGPSNSSNSVFNHFETDRAKHWFNTEVNVNGEIYAGTNWASRVFHDTYHPNADKLTTARTISLTGDASGSTSFDGSGNVSINVSVANDSHTHRYMPIRDSRGAVRAPSYYTRQAMQVDFQPSSETGAGGDTWHAVMTLSKWSSFNSAHTQEQLVFTGGTLKHREATSDTAWGAYRTVADLEVDQTWTGTQTFSAKLYAHGGVGLLDNDYLTLGSAGDAELFCNGSHLYLDLNSGIGNFYIRDGSTTRFTFDDAGHFTASGNVTAYSDRRVKTNIEKIDNALDRVERLNGYTFDRTDIECPRQTGVIAQEVQEVLPEAVSEDEEGRLSVAYGNMVGLLIEAVKELRAEVKSLKEELGK